MQQIDQNIKILNKQTLYELLSQRFSKDEKKLSDIPNPALLYSASEAAKRIADAIRNKEKISLVGDYDVDGVSSTAIMVDFFRQIPMAARGVGINGFRKFKVPLAGQNGQFTTRSKAGIQGQNRLRRSFRSSSGLKKIQAAKAVPPIKVTPQASMQTA